MAIRIREDPPNYATFPIFAATIWFVEFSDWWSGTIPCMFRSSAGSLSFAIAN